MSIVSVAVAAAAAAADDDDDVMMSNKVFTTRYTSRCWTWSTLPLHVICRMLECWL